jgi:hypothetical protein
MAQLGARCIWDAEVGGAEPPTPTIRKKGFMNKENTEKLLKFKFFKPDRPPTQSLMCFGFAVGDGWFKLLWDLCIAIDKTNPPEEFEVVQVKEKFAGLRFYAHYCTEEINKLISEAESKSYKTCEICGRKGKVRLYRWNVTLCFWHNIKQFIKKFLENFKYCLKSLKYRKKK